MLLSSFTWTTSISYTKLGEIAYGSLKLIYNSSVSISKLVAAQVKFNDYWQVKFPSSHSSLNNLLYCWSYLLSPSSSSISSDFITYISKTVELIHDKFYGTNIVSLKTITTSPITDIDLTLAEIFIMD